MVAHKDPVCYNSGTVTNKELVCQKQITAMLII